jgi:fumarate reductase flavoprotein subunit
MAEKLGAYLVDMEYVKPTFGISATGASNVTFLVMFYNGAVIVNKDGKRFIDESSSYKDIGKAALDQPDSMGYQIFDHKLYETGLKKAKGMRPEKAMFGLDETRIKLLVKGDTIQELASNIAVPPEALQKTIDKYNVDAHTGKDLDFGRTALAGKTGRIVKIDMPPFYAYASKGMLPGTYGGIVVDEEMCVLNRKGKIAGLYAAGEIVGGFHGASYMTGTAAGKALIFGRIAGRNAAKY